MKALFLGGVFSKEMEEDILIKSKGLVQYAANKLQWNLIDGFLNTGEIDLNVISAPFVGSFPRQYRDLFIKKSIVLYKNSVRCEFVPFCNLWGYKSISRKNSLQKHIKEFLLEQSSKKVIFVYSSHTPFIEAAVFAKKKDPSIHICLIIPDLPQFMNLKEHISVVYSLLKSIDIKMFKNYVRFVDSFVLLTEQMKDELNVGNRPSIIVEGMVSLVNNSLDETSERNKKNSDNKSVVYTGTLNKKFGVVNLVEAFHAIDNPNVTLNICGRGDAESLIKNYAKKDNRIQYFGQLTNEEALNLQKSATVLINPRQNNEEYTKYSFPSKNLEYLLSGNPVIAYKLDGIPDEYDEYFFYVKNNSIESLTKKLIEVLSLSDRERYDFGRQGQEFVINNKNNTVICSKILKMIQSNL